MESRCVQKNMAVRRMIFASIYFFMVILLFLWMHPVQISLCWLLVLWTTIDNRMFQVPVFRFLDSRMLRSFLSLIQKIFIFTFSLRFHSIYKAINFTRKKNNLLIIPYIFTNFWSSLTFFLKSSSIFYFLEFTNIIPPILITLLLLYISSTLNGTKLKKKKDAVIRRYTAPFLVFVTNMPRSLFYSNETRRTRCGLNNNEIPRAAYPKGTKVGPGGHYGGKNGSECQAEFERARSVVPRVGTLRT